VSQWQASQLP